MRKLFASLFIIPILFVGLLGFATVYTPNTAHAAACESSYFLGLPTWYKYLESETIEDPIFNNNDDASAQSGSEPVLTCIVQLDSLADGWLVVAAIIEILIRIAAMVALGFLIYGGVTYILSQGAPEKTKQALQTIIYAIVGLVIAITATALITYLAGAIN